MRACFSDNAEIPIDCAYDIGEEANCLIASRGIPRSECQYWCPGRAEKLAQAILGDGYKITKKGGPDV